MKVRLSYGELAQPEIAAKAAKLHYISDQKPGFTRKQWGKGFRYFDKNGKPLLEKDHLARIQKLGIPPAWTNVWISPDPNSHLQVSGRDAKFRKQYLYHERWSALRNETKFERMISFAQSLPLIRKQVELHLALPGLPREKVLATIIKLLETTAIRVGNEEYAKTNQSFGLTTLRNQHVKIEQGTLQFRFRGKSGVFHKIELHDRHLARIVKKCQELPGQELFQYISEDQELHRIDSSDVNQYLHQIAGEEFTAKDFRTWTGTLYAAITLHSLEEGEKPSKRGFSQIVKQVAQRLGNTPSVCRKYYIHPVILKRYEKKEWKMVIEKEATVDLVEGLQKEEQAILQILKSSSSSG